MAEKSPFPPVNIGTPLRKANVKIARPIGSNIGTSLSHHIIGSIIVGHVRSPIVRKITSDSLSDTVRIKIINRSLIAKITSPRSSHTRRIAIKMFALANSTRTGIFRTNTVLGGIASFGIAFANLKSLTPATPLKSVFLKKLVEPAIKISLGGVIASNTLTQTYAVLNSFGLAKET